MPQCDHLSSVMPSLSHPFLRALSFTGHSLSIHSCMHSFTKYWVFTMLDTVLALRLQMRTRRTPSLPSWNYHLIGYPVVSNFFPTAFTSKRCAPPSNSLSFPWICSPFPQPLFPALVQCAPHFGPCIWSLASSLMPKHCSGQNSLLILGPQCSLVRTWARPLVLPALGCFG